MDPLPDYFSCDSILWQAADLPLECPESRPCHDELDDDNTSSPATQSVSQKHQTAANKVAPNACLTCREKHLKCSGHRPCSRCVAFGTDCTFVASRRGYRNARRDLIQRRQQDTQSSVAASTDVADSSVYRIQSPETVSIVGPHKPPKHLEPCETACPEGSPHGDQPYELTASNGLMSNDTDMLLTSFYFHAFASHPFVLPRKYLAKVEDRAMGAVIAAMKWVGSLYLPNYVASQADLYNEADALVSDPQTPRNGFLVQAMMLILVALDGCGEQLEAVTMLGEVEKLALEIKLHKREFAAFHGRDMPVLEESWRRTWWDLYVMDGMIAGVHRKSKFALFDVSCDVSLPCEEDEYLSCIIPPPHPLRALDDRGFTKGNRQLSSFSYRILSGRNLGALLRLPAACSPMDPAIQKIETLLTSWKLDIPLPKQGAIKSDGTADEMMFQAYMIMHATSILLHQPFSQLATRPLQTINACAPPAQPTQGPAGLDVHTTKMNASASAISAMVTCDLALISHSHFFTCILTLSSIVHLSRWALLLPTSDDDDLREQIRLNIGALERRSATWMAARRACTQITAVAKEIYQAKKVQQFVDSSIWDSVSETLFLGDDGPLCVPTGLENI